MSNINKQALRSTSDRDWFEDWFKREFHPDKTGPYIKDQLFFAVRAARAPLLDELEALENRNGRLEAIVAVAEQRNALMREWKRALKVPCDLVDDQVPLVIHGMVIRLGNLKETEEKLKSAEEQIAELVAAGIITKVGE